MHWDWDSVGRGYDYDYFSQGSGFNSPTLHEPGRVVHTCNPRLRRQKQEAQELKVIFIYIESLRSALDKWDPISKEGGRRKEREKERGEEEEERKERKKETLILPFSLIRPYLPRCSDTTDLLSMPQDLCTFWHPLSSMACLDYIIAAASSLWLEFPALSQGLLSHFCQRSAQSQLIKENFFDLLIWNNVSIMFHVLPRFSWLQGTLVAWFMMRLFAGLVSSEWTVSGGLGLGLDLCTPLNNQLVFSNENSS